MTVVAARVYRGVTTVVADSALCDEEFIQGGHRKIWKLNPNLIVGFSGDWGQICRARQSLQSRRRGLLSTPLRGLGSIDEFIFSSMVPIIPALGDGEESDLQLLVAVAGTLWSLGPLGEYSRYTTTYAAIGSGAPYAWGALAMGASPTKAVRVAIQFSPACRGPIRQEVIQ